MIRKSILLPSLLLCFSVAMPDAHADKDASKVHYAEAKKKYNLGEFDEAIELFKKAYSEHAAPAYLYNIAQAYRQSGNCPKALFFYERFLAEKPGLSQEGAIRGYVEALRKECPDDGSNVGALNEVDDPVAKPAPSAKSEPSKQPHVADSAPEPKGDAEPTRVSKVAAVPREPLVRLGVEGGLAMVDMGDVITPATPELAVAANYIHALGSVELRAGARVALQNMPYEAMDGTANMRLTHYQATLGAAYPLGDALRVGGDVAVGMLGISDLEVGNPFSLGAAERAGDSAFAFGLRAEVEYALASSIGLSGGLRYGTASVGENFAEDIASIGTLSVLGGARYRW